MRQDQAWQFFSGARSSYPVYIGLITLFMLLLSILTSSVAYNASKMYCLLQGLSEIERNPSRMLASSWQMPQFKYFSIFNS